jgi:hypothetical protein
MLKKSILNLESRLLTDKVSNTPGNTDWWLRVPWTGSPGRIKNAAYFSDLPAHRGSLHPCMTALARSAALWISNAGLHWS